jgi:predicted small metal-binding protein
MSLTLEKSSDKMPTFKCKDIGMDCTFETKAKSNDELIKQIKDHALKVHKIKDVSPELMTKISGAIKPDQGFFSKLFGK